VHEMSFSLERSMPSEHNYRDPSYWYSTLSQPVERKLVLTRFEPTWRSDNDPVVMESIILPA
jgi:hypothetical protein